MKRFLIVVFDALRPDMVSASLTPNLCAFADSGVRYNNSRAVFPTETRVNQSALVTGCRPGRHGIVGNKFIEPTASPKQLLNTGDEDQLRDGDARLGGALLAVPSLGELLAERGQRLATLSAGTPGGGRILNHRAEQHGSFRFAMHRPDAAMPAGVAELLQTHAQIGAIPPHAIPSLDWLSWATDAWLHYVEPEVRPDVGILWFCEPDNSYHYCGIGSPDNLAAIRHADQQFGRIVSALGDDPELQLITLSDHGQIAVNGEPIDLAAQLRDAGFSVAEVPGPQAELALALDSAGGIFVRDHDLPLTLRVIEWLRQQSWCGALSLDSERVKIDGVLSHQALGIDGPRAPDIGVVLRTSDEPGPWGWPGSTLHDAPYPNGGGTHGGLHPIELHNWLAMAGSEFATGRLIDKHAGIVDILPTLLHLLGHSVPEHVQGRVLYEALAADERRSTVTAESDQAIQAGEDELWVTQSGHTQYLDGLRRCN